MTNRRKCAILSTVTKVVRSRLMAELPFMASENIMMQAVEKGGNRQELHERLRQIGRASCRERV